MSAGKKILAAEGEAGRARRGQETRRLICDRWRSYLVYMENAPGRPFN